MQATELGKAPVEYQKAQQSLLRRFELPPTIQVWPVRMNDRPALVALAPSAVFISSPGGLLGVETELPYSEITDLHASDLRVEIVQSGGVRSHPVDLGTAEDVHAFARALARARIAARAEPVPGPSATSQVLMVTTNDVPGHEITKVHGDVFGLVVLARNMFSNIGASLRTVVGGEVVGYTTMLTDSRNQARERLAEQALARGANAVVAMRFDCNDLADIMSEVTAYGTAVNIHPLTGAAAHRAERS